MQAFLNLCGGYHKVLDQVPSKKLTKMLNIPMYMYEVDTFVTAVSRSATGRQSALARFRVRLRGDTLQPPLRSVRRSRHATARSLLAVQGASIAVD